MSLGFFICVTGGMSPATPKLMVKMNKEILLKVLCKLPKAGEHHNSGSHPPVAVPYCSGLSFSFWFLSLDLVLLYSPEWPWTHDAPASASGVLVVQAYAISSDVWNFIFSCFNFLTFFVCMWVGVWGGKKRASDSVKLGLQVVGSPLRWVTGTELWSSQRSVLLTAEPSLQTLDVPFNPMIFLLWKGEKERKPGIHMTCPLYSSLGGQEVGELS